MEAKSTSLVADELGLASPEVLGLAEKAIIELLGSASPSEKRRAAEFVVDYHRQGGLAQDKGIATKEDLDRVGKVVGEIKTFLEGSALVGASKGGST